MRTLISIVTIALLLLAPAAGYAGEAEKAVEKAVEKTVELARENPGKAAGVAGCAAILIFPPAALWCLATLAGGATYDGDTKELIDKATK